MSTLETNLIQPATGTTLTVGASGDTITIPSGATISNSGTATGFGKILQVVQGTHTAVKTVTATSYTTSDLTAAITPTSTSNKVLVVANARISVFGDGSSSSGRVALFALFRGTVSDTKIMENQIGLSDRTASTSVNTTSYIPGVLTVLDSPSTTSSQTYTLGLSGSGAADIQLGGGSSELSTLTLMEVSA
jgi:hypothetical protein